MRQMPRRCPISCNLYSLWIPMLVVIATASGVRCFSANSSHKSEAISSIPWNLLLDPSYTSHKVSAPSKNQVIFSPPSYGQSSASSSAHHQRPITTTLPASYSPQVHYSPTVSTSASSSTHNSKYSIPIPNNFNPNDPYGNHYGSFSNSFTVPSGGGYYGNGAEASHSKSKQQKGTEHDIKRNRKNNKPKDDYYDFMDDEDDSQKYFQEYEDSYKFPNYQESSNSEEFKSPAHQDGGDELTSFNGPNKHSEGFVEKVRDILRGGSQQRPNYASSPEFLHPSQYTDYNAPSSYPSQSNYYPNYSPEATDKHKNGDYDPQLHHFPSPSNYYPSYTQDKNKNGDYDLQLHHFPSPSNYYPSYTQDKNKNGDYDLQLHHFPSPSNYYPSYTQDKNKNGDYDPQLHHFPSPSNYYPSYTQDKNKNGDYDPQLHHFPSPSNYYPSYAQDKHKNGDYDPPPYHYYPEEEPDNSGSGKYDAPISVAEKKKGTRYGPLAFALGLLPLGLLLASLVPTVVSIPVTTAVATGRKRRSIQFVNPVLDKISSYGIKALDDPQCLQRVFCDVVIEGKENKSTVIQKIYYRVSNIIDESWMDSIGLKQLLQAVRSDRCNTIPCLHGSRTR